MLIDAENGGIYIDGENFESKEFDDFDVVDIYNDHECYFRSIDFLKEELKDLFISEDKITSMIFYNMGFLNHPSNKDWMDRSITSETIFDKKNKFSSDIKNDEKIKSILFGKEENLESVINKIYFWIYGDIKHGYLMDMKESFLIDRNKLLYNLSKNIRTSLSFVLEEDESYWDSTNIIYSRRYELNPDIDSEYFDFCIKDEEIFLSTKIDNPQICFVLSVINPDILFSIIRESEMKACRESFLANNLKYSALLDDEDCEKYFTKYLNENLNNWWNVFVKYGLKGLEDIDNYNYELEQKEEDKMLYDKLYRENRISPKTIVDIMNNYDKMIDDFSLLSEYQKNYLLENMIMNESKIMFINKKVDMRFIPKVLEEDDHLLNMTYRRLYICLVQMEKYYPGLLDPEIGKLSISENGFIDPLQFCLYNKKYNCFIILHKGVVNNEQTNFVTSINSPNSTVTFYDKNYNIDFEFESDLMAIPYNLKLPEFVIPENMK